MRKQLSFVDRMDRLFALRLDHKPSLNDEVRAKSAIQLDSFIDQRHNLLPLNPKSNLLEFVGQASFISRFEQPRPKPPVNLDCRSDNLRREIKRENPALWFCFPVFTEFFAHFVVESFSAQRILTAKIAKNTREGRKITVYS